MQYGEHGGDAEFEEPVDHAGVLIESFLIEFSRFGFKASPFDREAIAVHAKFSKTVEIFSPPVPMVDGVADARIEAIVAKAPLFLPDGHVIVYAALYLIGGCRGSPEKGFVIRARHGRKIRKNAVVSMIGARGEAAGHAETTCR